MPLTRLVSRVLDTLPSKLAGRLAACVPSQCAICRSWAAERLCLSCVHRFNRPLPRCTRCALEVPQGVSVCGACVKSPPAFDHAFAAVTYAFPWDTLILQLKFNGAIDLAASLARLMLDAWQQSGTDPLPDLLLPVPLSAARLRERGFNQAWELTRRLGRALAVPAEPRLLLRVKETPHQLALPVDRRAANVRGAFAVEAHRRAEVCGRHVVVVDDVMTTGATGEEIARVLRQAGAATVDIRVLARTPKR